MVKRRVLDSLCAQTLLMLFLSLFHLLLSLPRSSQGYLNAHVQAGAHIKVEGSFIGSAAL